MTPPADASSEPRHDETASLARLLGIMVRLRAPDGCPWDQVQDFRSIAPYTIEEAYEVEDAINRGNWVDLRDELGDLLFQVVYHSRMAEEAGHFRFSDVAETIGNKMLARHPHVFASGEIRDAAAQTEAWERRKAAERAARGETGTLAGVPGNLPALTEAAKLTRRAGRVGFDWPDADSVLQKLDEEVAELRAELPAADPARLADEVGDMLFVLANLARKLDLDPEQCLRGSNRKFRRRFGAIEQGLAESGRSPADATLTEMEELWQAAKRAEKSESGPSERDRHEG
ncbi:nucleoside triphosphate pyrophosphohydrolase [Roseomonas elaeocarpi]|uniref:Nucleoside triphosphate pyrophosphohydrolase n=1 Tax=Roseomonas elaeocarpi TaxID=907779 RepID=A0ABV6JXU3_9PROT